MMLLIFQILICLVLIVLGAFFAGSETGVYSLSRFQLRLGVQQRRRFFALLSKIMDDSGGLVFSLLIATNLTHYLLTSIVTIMFLDRAISSQSAELYATVLIAPVVFVFAEVIPKNIYYHRSDRLMPRFAPVLWFFHKVFTYTGTVALLRGISQIFARLLGVDVYTPAVVSTTGRGQINQIIRETHDEGILSLVQNDIMNRLVNIPDMTVNSVKTPITKVRMVEVNTDRADLLRTLTQSQYTRLPVYERRHDNIIGFINIYEALSSGEDFEDLRKFVKPIARFSSTTFVIDAINKMRSQSHKIVLVTIGRREKAVTGIVTMKDLVEELTGELAQW